MDDGMDASRDKLNKLECGQCSMDYAINNFFCKMTHLRTKDHICSLKMMGKFKNVGISFITCIYHCYVTLQIFHTMNYI